MQQLVLQSPVLQSSLQQPSEQQVSLQQVFTSSNFSVIIKLHEINEIIDSGNLILRKKIIFKNIKNHTFNSTYKILITEIENLFKKNYLKIINQRYKIIKFREKGTYHSKKELPKSLNTWNVKILKYLKFYFK